METRRRMLSLPKAPGTRNKALFTTIGRKKGTATPLGKDMPENNLARLYAWLQALSRTKGRSDDNVWAEIRFVGAARAR
jgi:hypothetical protein